MRARRALAAHGSRLCPSHRAPATADPAIDSEIAWQPSEISFNEKFY